MNGQAPEEAAEAAGAFEDGTLPVDPALVTNTLLRALLETGRAAASSGHSGAEAKDYAAAALNLAQAIVVLDPELSQGGTPLQHDVLLKGMEHDSNERIAAIHATADVEKEQVRGEHAIRQAQEAAAAPTPRKKLTVSRTDGRISGIEQEG